MLSMTGYGNGEYRNSDYVILVEIKSYNNRYLDISHSISPSLLSYEEYIDSEIKKVCKRGHIDVSVFLKTIKTQSHISLDEGLVEEYMKAFTRIGEITGGDKPSVIDYATMEGVLLPIDDVDSSVYSDGVSFALKSALEKLRKAKEREGEGTKADLERLGGLFSSSLSVILEKRDELEGHFKRILLEKYEELLGEKGKDDPRFLSEVAALLVKYSINEEGQRLKVHLRRYYELIESNESVGKELDFLCQEMNREINTIASKSQMAEINLSVVKMKDALEDIREQVRNIE